MVWRHVVTGLRVGGILIAAIGMSFLDTGFRLDFTNLDGPTKAAFTLIGIGVVAEVVSFAIPGGRTRQDYDD